jgi:hypothetical protein
VKITPKSILKFTAIAFLVVTPLAMAMLQIPTVRNSVFRSTGLQNSESQPSVVKNFPSTLPSGTAQTPLVKTDTDNPGLAETAEAVKPQPVVAEKKTDRDPAPQKTGVVLPRTVDAQPFAGQETDEARYRTASVPGSFAGQERDQDRTPQNRSRAQSVKPDKEIKRKPKEERLIKAREFRGDLRQLPYRKPKIRRERPERELEPNPTLYVPPGTAIPKGTQMPESAPVVAPEPKPPAPPPINVFEGLDRFTWGAGSPPDTIGDVGPTYYIQSVNASVGIYRKSDGFQEAAFTFDTLMSQGNFGNQCDTENFGDPVVLYDTFDDRWILTDFAFTLDGGGNVNPAIAFQCFAVSQTGNPLTGGWYFYSRTVTDGLNDYPKLGIWPDGLYMSANMFGYAANAPSQAARAWAFNKSQMYAGSPTVKVVSFDIGGGEFTVIPSNARLQTGTPPTGRPNLFISSWLFTNAVTIYKFHVDWTNLSLSTFTGPDVPIAATSWPNAAVANVPQSGTTNLLDALQIRAMMQNQYTNFGGTESLWLPHTVRRANTTGFAAPRWYQVNVTGGTVNASIPQAATWDPDGANVLHRWMPSLALDRAGNMAMGYSVSSSTTFPSIRYAGRLAADPVNTFSQTEQILFTGTASQTTTTRWGDYSSMTLDPDGCTFWYTNQYANPANQASNMRWLTKFGSFSFAGCTPFGAGGTISGTVTLNPGGAPISGATVQLGARSTSTAGSGNYSFLNIPAGTYPTISASKPGFTTGSASDIVVTDGGTTTQDFALSDAADSACLTDTTQADFLAGIATNVDLTTSPGDVTLVNIAVDQQNTAGTTTGTGFGSPAWTGQTFIPSVTGQLLRVETTIFCNGCGATPPNLTLSVRATAAGLPTGADLASVTIPGSNYSSGSTVTFMATFGAPATLTAGTQYALVMRPVSAPAGSGYFWIRSSPSTYANGSRVLSADSGGTWSADTTRDYNFKAVMAGPYSPTSGNLVSSPKDSNPAAGLTPIWTTLSWNGTTQANTSLQFQIGASNSVNGPFSFVGPDGTAGTFFTTSPASLAPFYGFRYLQYKAYLSTTNNAVTPVLSDVTLCYNDVDCSGVVATITPTPTEVCADSTGNTASGPAGMTTYSWSITNGTITSATNIQSITYTAGASGTVTLNLTVTAPNGCIASSSAPITINPIPATPTITPGGPTTFCDGGSVTLDSSSAAGNQWYLDGNPIAGATNQQYVATAGGDYAVVVTENSCSGASSTVTTVTVNPLPPTPTITPSGPTTFCGGGSVTLSSSSASGNQWYLNGNPMGGATGQQYIATVSGNYTVTVTDGNSCTSAPSSSTTVTVPGCLSIHDAKAAEPSSGTIDMVFTVALSAPASGAISVNFTTQDEAPALNHAVAGVCGSGGDYVATNGTVSFTSGQQVNTISVPVCSDGVAEPDETFLVVLSSPSGTNIVDGTATGTITAANPAGAVLISELRTAGPGGAGDDFVEIYNNSNSPLTVAASDASAGYGLYQTGADCNATPVLIGVIPNGTVIPARGHYLFVGSAYSLGNYGGSGAAAGNLTFSSDIETDRNIGLFSTSNVIGISSVNRLDAVGFGVNTGGACNLLREATTLPPIAGNATIEHSYFRKMCDWLQGQGCTVPGIPKDTNINAEDFWLADTAGSVITGRLGAPGPENLASPIRRDNTGINFVVLDGTVGPAVAPNRDRNSGDPAGTFGSMTLRYRVTNNTGAPVTRLRYRVVDISTAIQPAGPTADLRALTSSVQSGVGPVNDTATCTAAGAGAPPCTVTVQATTLETPPNQAIGGGYNSTLSSGTITIGSPLPNNQSILINLKLGVQKTGTFRFYIIVEALP